MTRRANGTFLPGYSPGKPRGVRNRLAHQIFVDAFAHWCEIEQTSGKRKGEVALELMFREKPHEYCRLMSGLLPKQFEHTAAELDLPDEELDELITSLRRRLTEQQHIERPLLPVVKVKEPVQ